MPYPPVLPFTWARALLPLPALLPFYLLLTRFLPPVGDMHNSDVIKCHHFLQELPTSTLKTISRHLLFPAR